VKDSSFRSYVLDQLRGLDNVRCRAMFGGYGLYLGQVFFGIISEGRVYFRTDERSRSAYVELGMGPFQPNPGQTLKTYYEVPGDVIEDEDRFTEWARTAAAAERS
jgi:DNA transformation protein and related proteins